MKIALAKVVVKIVVKILIFWFTTTSFALFILEEGAQTLGFCRFIDKAADIREANAKICSTARAIGYLNPIAWIWFRYYFEASAMYANQMPAKKTKCNSNMVWMSENGKKYHFWERCPYYGRGAELDIEEARRKGATECKICEKHILLNK